jgi:hypothetical protein
MWRAGGINDPICAKALVQILDQHDVGVFLVLSCVQQSATIRRYRLQKGALTLTHARAMVPNAIA